MSPARACPVPESGDRLTFLYEAFRTADQLFKDCPSAENQQPLEAAKAALFIDISNYAERILSKLSAKNDWTFGPQLNQRVMPGHGTDVTQAVCLKVWKHLAAGRFKGQSQFSTWLYTVCKNAITDMVRKRAKLNECDLKDWKAYGDEYCGHRNGPGGAAPGSDHTERPGEGLANDVNDYDADGMIVLPPPYECSNDESSMRGHGRQPLMSKQFRESNETERIDNMDYKAFLATLIIDYQTLLNLRYQGCSAKEIAPFFGKDARWVDNKIAELRRKQRNLPKAA